MQLFICYQMVNGCRASHSEECLLFGLRSSVGVVCLAAAMPITLGASVCSISIFNIDFSASRDRRIKTNKTKEVPFRIYRIQRSHHRCAARSCFTKCDTSWLHIWTSVFISDSAPFKSALCSVRDRSIAASVQGEAHVWWVSCSNHHCQEQLAEIPDNNGPFSAHDSQATWVTPNMQDCVPNIRCGALCVWEPFSLLCSFLAKVQRHPCSTSVRATDYNALLVHRRRTVSI